MKNNICKSIVKLGVSLGLVWGSVSVQAVALQAPEGFYQKNIPVAAGKQEASCPAVDVYDGLLQLDSKYDQTDPAKDVIDPATEQHYQAAIKPMQDLQALSERLSDRLFKGAGSRDDLACIMLHWRSWADAGALLQSDANPVGRAVRKWTLAAVASNYLKLKLNLSDLMAPTDVAVIDNWIARLATQVRSDYQGRTVDQVNNHDYWAAWSVMVSAVILQRQDLFQWSDQVLTQALQQINTDGYLSTELKRKTRALFYHNFALEPLVAMALFAEKNEQALTPEQHQALTRLVTMVLHNMNNPYRITAAAGARQMGEDLRRDGRLAWMAPYEAMTGDVGLRSLIIRLQPLHSSRLGGDQVYLYLRNDTHLVLLMPATELKQEPKLAPKHS
jgi:poly(beta-D-mannuronate) lyase